MSLLRKFSSIKIGGEAERILWLSEVIREKIKFSSTVRILGNGSNVLMDDRGLKTAVILTREAELSEPEILRDDSSELFLKIPAGFFMPTLSRWASNRGLTGCEYMVGVPGTLGGALIQNAGANEQELKDILHGAEVYDLGSGEMKSLSPEDCKLRYRASDLFESNLLVVSVSLRLQKSDATAIEKQTEKNLLYRKESTPYSKPSLGSMYTRLKDAAGAWIYPGKLIEDAGLKGFQIGSAQVSEKHANYFINLGGATFMEMRQLMTEVEKRVFDHSGVRLRPEVAIWSDRDDNLGPNENS